MMACCQAIIGRFLQIFLSDAIVHNVQDICIFLRFCVPIGLRKIALVYANMNFINVIKLN